MRVSEGIAKTDHASVPYLHWLTFLDALQEENAVNRAG